MLSEEWKALTEDERQPYKEAAAKDAQRAKAANMAAGITSKTRAAGASTARKGHKRKGSSEQDGAAADAPVKPAPATKRQHALAAAVDDDGARDDERQREECDWEAHPAEAILAETDGGKVLFIVGTQHAARNDFVIQFVVKRRGMPLFEYGLVDAVSVRSQRTQPHPGCPVPLSMLENYERFTNGYRKQVASCTLDNELDLGMPGALAHYRHLYAHHVSTEDLPSDSLLEACSFLGSMREPGYPLSRAVAGKDVMIRLPMMGLSRLVQRMMELERGAPRFEE